MGCGIVRNENHTEEYQNHVANEVREHLEDPPFVEVRVQRNLRKLSVQCDAFGGGDLRERFVCFAQELGDFDLLGYDCELARVDGGDIDEVIDQPVHLRDEAPVRAAYTAR